MVRQLILVRGTYSYELADIVAQANDSVYGLAAAVFSKDISRAITVAQRLKAGTVWVNCYNKLHAQSECHPTAPDAFAH